MSHIGDDEVLADDEVLMSILGKALHERRDLPPEWREAAHAAYAWRTVDEELLALTHDSAVDAGVAVRGVGDPRTVSFTGGGLSLEVELSERQIMGQLSAPVPSEVTFESADGRVRAAPTDDSGFFSLTNEDHGLVRFALRADDRRYVTEWIVL